MVKSKPELLAPAGSYGSMVAAINAGADAVYIGGSRFGARAYADNLDEDDMLRAIDFAHLYGRRIYMTVNTLMKESELDQLPEYIRPYYLAGLDAALVQDLGAMSLLGKNFPGLPLHISTQMTAANVYSIKKLMGLGAARAVLPRELSLREIKRIIDETGIEAEVFVHGALCYCYSGQCLFSSLIGGRSGNRGRCAQTCRLPFDLTDGETYLNRKDEKYLLSMKDLCALDALPELIDAGVASFKIEGRMKSPRYTAGVVSIYRKYIDLYLREGKEGYHIDSADNAALLELFDRGGQTDGYFKRHNGRDMVVLKEKPGFRKTDRELFDRLDRDYVNGEKKIFLTGAVMLKAGRPVRFCVSAWPGDSKEPIEGTAAAGPEDSKELIGDIAAAEHEDAGAPGNKGREAFLNEGNPAFSARVVVWSDYDIVEEAKSAPTDEDMVRKQLLKTGGTPFEFKALDVSIEGNVFVPVSRLNAMRRDMLDKVGRELVARYRRPGFSAVMAGGGDGGQSGAEKDSAAREHGGGLTDADCRDRDGMDKRCLADSGNRGLSGAYNGDFPTPEFCALVNDKEQFGAALRFMRQRKIETPSQAFGIYLASSRFGADEWGIAVSRCHEAGVGCYLMLPRIFRAREEKYFLDYLGKLKSAGFDAAGIAAMDEPGFLERYMPGMRQYFNFGMYAMNSLAGEAMRKFGAARLTIPLELNLREIAAARLTGELIVYGRLPVMVAAQCLKKTAKGCDGTPGFLFLRDRLGKTFPVYTDCRFCGNTIYNETPLSLHGFSDEIKRLGPQALRLIFTDEDAGLAGRLLEAFYDDLILGREADLPIKSFTRGHFRRGVE